MALLSCTREEILEPTAEDAASGSGLSLCIGDVGTRLSYSGATTSFEDGDYIGAVVCKVGDDGTYEYYCTTRWKYNSSGKLTPDKIWTYSSSDGTWSSESDLLSDDYSDSDSTPLFTYDNDCYVGVNSEDELYLFFHCPFIDPETEDLSAVPSYTSDETTTLLMGMAASSDASSVTSDGVTVPAFDWESFPMFVNKDQSTSAAHQMSDFLWANFTIGISSSSTGTHYVSFSKMTATIRVKSYKEISDIRLYSADSSDPIVIGQKIDLKDAELADYDSSDEVYSYTVLGSDEYIIPYNNTSTSDDDGETTYYYRFLLPQQASFSGTLKVKFADGSSTETSTSSIGGASLFGSSSARGGAYLSSSGGIVALADDSGSYSLTLSCVSSDSGSSFAPEIYYYIGTSAPSQDSSDWGIYSSAVSVTSGNTVFYYASSDGYTTSTTASTTVYADTEVQFTLSSSSSNSGGSGDTDSGGSDSGGSDSGGSGGSSDGSGDSGGSGDSNGSGYSGGSNESSGGASTTGISTMADDSSDGSTSYSVTLNFVDSESGSTVDGATIYYYIGSTAPTEGSSDWSTYSSAVSVTSGSTIYYYASATGYTTSSTSACSLITSDTSITVDLTPESYTVTITAVDGSYTAISSGATIYYQIGSTSGDWSSVASGSSVSVLYGRTIYYYATYSGTDYSSGSASSASSATITADTSLTYALSDYWDISQTLSFTSLATGNIYYVNIVEYSFYCYFSKSDWESSGSSYSDIQSNGTTVTTALVTDASDVFSWGYDSTSGSPSTFGSGDSVTIDSDVISSSFTDYMKLEGTPKTYLQLTTSRKSDITVYLVYQTSTPAVKLVNSSGTTVDTQTATSSTDGTYMTLTFEDVSAGTYKIMRSSNTCHLLLVTVEG